MNLATKAALATLAAAGAGTAIYMSGPETERIPYVWLVADGGVTYAVTQDGDTISEHSTWHGAARTVNELAAELCQEGRDCPELRIGIDQGWRAEIRWAEVVPDSTEESGEVGTVTDLQADSSWLSTVWLSWTEVDDGTGSPADYRIRWDTAQGRDWETEQFDVVSGSCFWPVEGVEIGAQRSCSISGVPPDTDVHVQLRAYQRPDEGWDSELPWPADSIGPPGAPLFEDVSTDTVTVYWTPALGSNAYEVSWRGGVDTIPESELRLPDWPEDYGGSWSWVCVQPLSGSEPSPEHRCDVLEDPSADTTTAEGGGDP